MGLAGEVAPWAAVKGGWAEGAEAGAGQLEARRGPAKGTSFGFKGKKTCLDSGVGSPRPWPLAFISPIR